MPIKKTRENMKLKFLNVKKKKRITEPKRMNEWRKEEKIRRRKAWRIRREQ